MSHPKDAWKFKLWSDAMLRGAQVREPHYLKKKRGSTASPMKRKRRRKRKKKNAKAW